MRKYINLALVISIAYCLQINLFSEEKKPTHLFMLSGQSNMPKSVAKSFKKVVEKEYGESNVIVAHDYHGGQPIMKWYKKYKYPEDSHKSKKAATKAAASSGVFYDVLMKIVGEESNRKSYDTVTFIWMQGENDAHSKLYKAYEQSFKGILQQFKDDLKSKKINFVIGRLSDYGFCDEAVKKGKWPEWEKIREIHVKLAEEDENGAWVNTDDLNNRNIKGVNVDGLHYSGRGYSILGKRFAEKSIELIKNRNESLNGFEANGSENSKK